MALAAGVPSATAQPLALRWSEDATRDFYDRAMRRRWLHQLGDWTDAQGRPQGAVPFAQRHFPALAPGMRVAIDVTAPVRDFGADFLLLVRGGALRVYTRESVVAPPMLVVEQAGASRLLAAEADTWLAPSTNRPMGAEPTLLIQWSALLRFPQPADRSIDRATLYLTVVKPYGAPTVLVMRPTPFNPVSDASPPPRRR